MASRNCEAEVLQVPRISPITSPHDFASNDSEYSPSRPPRAPPRRNRMWIETKSLEAESKGRFCGVLQGGTGNSCQRPPPPTGYVGPMLRRCGARVLLTLSPTGSHPPRHTDRLGRSAKPAPPRSPPRIRQDRRQVAAILPAPRRIPRPRRRILRLRRRTTREQQTGGTQQQQRAQTQAGINSGFHCAEATASPSVISSFFNAREILPNE